MSVVVIEIPASLKLLITSARIVLPPEPAARSRPFAPLPALVPSRSMSGAVVYPGCVVPSIVTGTVMFGRADNSEIVWAPAPMPKSIVFDPGAAFEFRIACRSEPAPESAAVLTRNVAGIIRFSRPKRDG